MKRWGRSPRPILTLVALTTFAGSLGLILPGVLGFFPRIIPVTAGILCLLLLVSLFLHVRSREKPKVFVSVVLSDLTAFVAWGRWAIIL